MEIKCSSFFFFCIFHLSFFFGGARNQTQVLMLYFQIKDFGSIANLLSKNVIPLVFCHQSLKLPVNIVIYHNFNCSVFINRKKFLMLCELIVNCMISQLQSALLSWSFKLDYCDSAFPEE